MKSFLIALIFSLPLTVNADDDLSRYVREHGSPIAAATTYERKPDEQLRTYVFYGLDQSPISNLEIKSERTLIYANEDKFKKHIGYHFEDIQKLLQ